MLYLDSQFDQFRLINEEQEMDTEDLNDSKLDFQNNKLQNKSTKNVNSNVKLIVPNNMTDLITDDERDPNMSL